MSDSLFHPAVTAWLNASFGSATLTQAQAWPAIQSNRDVLIAAPTGSGKTLAAFMSAIDTLVRAGIKAPLPDETAVLYVSPLKALSNIERYSAQPGTAACRYPRAARCVGAARHRHPHPCAHW